MIAVTRVGERFRVELRGADGKATGRETVKSFNSARQYDEAAKLLGVDAQAIMDAVASERVKQVESEPALANLPPFAVRPLQGNERKHYTSLEDALNVRPGVESVIEWGDLSECCAVDFDWHGVDAPADIIANAYHVKPRPAYAWVTRSGGLRLIYTGPDADALAAAGAISIQARLHGYTGIEFLTHTRFPASEPVRLCPGTLGDISAQFADDVDPGTVEEWLAENGYAIGQRYPHDRCPIDPDHVSSAPDPVSVRERGVFCHSCSGRTGRGFRSFAALLGVQVDSTLSRMVRGFVHWDHAKLILSDLFDMPEMILRSYYRACLLGKHGPDDSRIASAFLPHGIVRGSGLWLTMAGEARNPTHLRATVAGLPATQNDAGNSIAAIAEKFLDNVALDSHGYEPVKLVHGMRIGTRWDSPDKRPRLVIPVAGNVPEYVGPETRLDEPEAWRRVEEAYPRIDRKLIELLVVARGHVERGTVSMPPIIFLDGVSGSGKTSHLQLAAAFCGDRCTDLIPSPNDDEMGKRLWEAFQRGSFISVNEAAKGAHKAKVDQTTFLNFILHISPTVTYRVLYRGYAALGGSPIISITDIEFDDAVMSDGQLGRRAFYRSLGTEPLDWKSTSAAYGLGQWSDIRGEAAELGGLRLAVDSLLSTWVDRYFMESIPTLDEVAASLGISYMNQSGPAAERLATMKRLFEAWQEYPGPDQASTRNRQRRGFKAFRPADHESNDLAAIWQSLHDAGDPFQWRRACELSWQRATGWHCPVKIDFKPLDAVRRDYLQMRFREQVAGKWSDIFRP